MTDRLRHSDAGYRRLIQISQAEFFVIVEGRLDRFFYDEICRLALFRHGVRFDIRMVAELPVSTGGKPGVLQFFDAVRARKELVSHFKGKTTVMLFFLDKDVDDVIRIRRRSAHVIYTDIFEVENYLFRYGDITRSLAVVLRLPRQAVEGLLPWNWQTVAAEAWRDWTTLCVAVQILRISVEANYRVPSRLNQPCLAPSDHLELERRIADMRSRSGLVAEAFDAIVTRATRTVARRYQSRRHDTVFRGKWYITFLRHWTASTGSVFGDDELVSALLASLEFESDWAVPLVQAVENVARKSGLVAA